MIRVHPKSRQAMNEGNGHSEEGRAQGVVAWIVVFAVAAVVTGFCAKYLYD